MTKQASAGERDLVAGEFFTDGAKFIFRLSGLPISGVGDTPQAAFDDLMRQQGQAGDLVEKLRLIAREQQGEQVRASLIRSFSVGLIALTLIGGLVAGIGALAPKLAADLADTTISALDAPAPQIPAADRAAVSEALDDTQSAQPAPTP